MNDILFPLQFISLTNALVLYVSCSSQASALLNPAYVITVKEDYNFAETNSADTEVVFTHSVFSWKYHLYARKKDILYVAPFLKFLVFSPFLVDFTPHIYLHTYPSSESSIPFHPKKILNATLNQ